uniref:Pyrophosphate--fructose 6-phosphate 1-phosphotransferase n=1 Tax=Naegleria fowleri TaxID=5763 RepID=PFP_NAEFO|nr:RecName: Full=Pyrophosphate--fructose 6-phosphate 1-phosphotransferase; AltName: Full=6-phosphofructokinase, pyrophosphate dependent; AltName: Full=PPi-dependent phosphofructokinase; Short=PPi-PFK; AltName: Full=Pyrophosphate-dependent 6-phosphofructose-1-kinase [Naegleria fowleri]AAA85791.1 pyrophosphate-dependent phosphofructo-1-kinase [Naegleria fowleri]
MLSSSHLPTTIVTPKNVPTLGVLVGGGPAPGINGVIGAVTIEAINNGYRVLGFLEGFQNLILQDDSKIVELTIDSVSRIHFEGGSILKTSRANPTKKQEDLQKVVKQLQKFNVSLLVTIGGDDTAFSSMSVAKAANNEIHVVTLPKTIDNDLPLPYGIPTFGYETAREFGANVVRNLMTDASTASRYFIVVAMGRQAGHLALGIGKSAGSHLTLIPEEFLPTTDSTEPEVTFSRICDMIEASIIKRLYTSKKDHGVIVLAEGLLEYMSTDELKQAFGSSLKYDAHDHIMLAELDFGRLVRDEMRERMNRRGLKIAFTEKNLGYELRCAPPNAFDREYTRDLGNGAVRYLLNGGNGALITVQGVKMVPLSFDDLKDPRTGKTRTRQVDVSSEGFQVAKRYMIRLEKKDFEKEETLKGLAATAKCSVEDFIKQFKYLVQ